MKVLLTGGEGYIGTLLAPMLFERGHDVTVYDTGFHRVGWLYDGVTSAPRWNRLDTRAVTQKDLEGFEAVIHLADLSNDPVGDLNPELTFDINHAATIRLAEMAKAAGVERFVYSSSCSVYGASGDDEEVLATEESPTGPLTAYAKCKLLCEDDLGKLADENFTPTYLRNGTAFGASPRMRFDLVINDLTAQAYLTKKLILESDGTPWRPFVHVADIGKAMYCALEADADIVRDEAFNVGDTRSNYQVRDICKIIGEEIDGCEVVIGEKGGDNRNYRVNFDKINSKLPGFSCDYEVRNGVQEMVKIFDRIGFTEDQQKHRGHRRIQQINHLLETKQINDNFYWI
jgi:nucleoside-diphosphate-sugar epimerase